MGRLPLPPRNALDRLIKQSGVTQADVARKCGVTVPAVQSWVAGRAAPGAANAVKLADVLGVTVAEIVTALPVRTQGKKKRNGMRKSG